ncbi:50S ribosomal protein L7/L12 [Babesia sp. Xinjiang]|uniref:50S ribosomal protein L7/L12 n=1 Tax=Babesia sp. Xinjiang TaxID=462227 RepID=UPI000A24DC18|nr:50S ribosomal protein L7/L12 [Babesia sp. Xinjiang]ORM41840.1 50S ribosomal protein L7/L12 [Babesia sp. Xinjiang]
MGSCLHAELLCAFRVRFESVVNASDLQNSRVSFIEGSESYTTSELYRFFDLSNIDVSCASSVRELLDRDFVESIRLLDSTPPENVRLSALYPLLRRILILTEGYLRQVSSGSRFEGSVAQGYSSSFLDLPLYTILDDVYGKVCGHAMQREKMLSGLSSISSLGSSNLENVLVGASTLANLLVPIIAHAFENSVADELESTLAVFTFGALQRISALFLLLVVVDQSINPSDGVAPESKDERIIVLSGDLISNENMKHLEFLCTETLQKALMTKVTDHYLAVSWQEDVVLPVLRMLESAFLSCGKLVIRRESLADLVLTTTVMFVSKIPNDCPPSRSTVELILVLGRKFLGMFSQGTEQVNVALWSHFNARLSHVLKVQHDKEADKSAIVESSSNTPTDQGPGKLGLISTGSTSSASQGSSNASSPRPVSLSVSALVGEGELKSVLIAFVASLKYYERHVPDLFDILFGAYRRKTDVEIVDCLSRLYVQFSSLVQLVDSLFYITRRSPNRELRGLFDQAIGSLWSIIQLLGSRLPFEVLKACFYDLGSDFHSCNIAAQICCFKSLPWDISVLRACYEEQNAVYNFRVDMLRVLLRNSSRSCSFCISYGLKRPRNIRSAYLTISSVFISRWFVTELLFCDIYENYGLIDAFVEWCHSDRLEEYMLSRFLCRTIVRLSKEDESFVDSARYLLDILLGVCMHHEPISEGMLGVLRPLDPGRVNAFGCLGVVFSSGLFTEWLMRHIIMPSTCAFVKNVKEHLSVFLGPDAEPWSYECYFVVDGSGCECSSACIVGSSQGILPYLELLSVIPSACYDIEGSDALSRMFRHMLDVLCSLVVTFVQVLTDRKDCGDILLRYSLFVLSVRLARVLVCIGKFGRKDVEVVSLLKLFSLLGNPQVCVIDDAHSYLCVISDAICIFHWIFEHVPVKEQLLKLHRGFLTVLLSKMGRFPLFLLRHELYNNVPRAMFEQLSGYFSSILEKSRSLGLYYGTLYSLSIWNALRRYGIERVDLSEAYVDRGLCSSGSSTDLRITVNIASSCELRASKVDDILAELKTLTLLETSELVKKIEETFGVSASMAVSAAPAASGVPAIAAAVAEDDDEEEKPRKTSFEVVLLERPEEQSVRMALFRVLRKVMPDKPLTEVKAAIDNAPTTLKVVGREEEAKEALKIIEGAGGKGEIR